MSKLFDIILDSPTGELEENTVPVLAEGSIEGFGSWTLDEDGLLIIDGIGDMPDWAQIPENGSEVPWVSYRKQIKEVHLSNGITRIGNRAFKACSELTRINIPKGITHIGFEAFTYCGNLCQVDLPDSIMYIGEAAFFRCRSLSRIDFPDSVTYIGNQAFGACVNLTRIDIPRNLVYLGDRAFDNRLQKVTMPSRFNKPFFENHFGFPSDIITFYEAEIFPVIVAAGTLEGFGQWSLDEKGLLKIEGKGEMPYWSWEYTEHTHAAPWYSHREKIQEIHLSEGITSISSYSFQHFHNLSQIDIPNSVTIIYESAFCDCVKLEVFNIPNGVTTIGREAFSGCDALKKISIPDSVTYIGKYAFPYTYSFLERDIFVEYLENFGTWVFQPFQSHFLPIMIIGKGNMPDFEYEGPWCGRDFDYEGSNPVRISNLVTSIGARAFRGALYLKQFEIPDSITSIGNGAFSECIYLTQITIPNSVTAIGNNAFESCRSLSQITIPNSVRELGSDVFRNCVNLRKVIMPSRFNRPLFKFYYGISKDIVTFY